MRENKFEKDVTFVLSDHSDLTSEEESQLLKVTRGSVRGPS